MPRKTRSVRKPRAMPLGRFADAMADEATCDQWGLVGGSGLYEQVCGRTVEVPRCVFDESGARQMRRLARWLDAAAAWVEERR